MNPSSMRHPGRWFWLLLLVPVVFGLSRLRFDAEVFDLLPADLPAVQGLKAYQRHFSNARELIITVQSSKAGKTEAAARSIDDGLRPLTNLVASVTWQPPWLEHPEQTADLLAYLWFNQPPEVFGQLTNRLATDQLNATLQSTRLRLATTLSPDEIARSSYDPFGLTRLPESVAGAAPSFSQASQGFSSPDGSFRIIYIRARNELRGYRECEQWLQSIKQAVAIAVFPLQSGNTDPVQISYTGRPAFVQEVASGMQNDMMISVGGTAAIIAILFWLAHRRLKPMLWLLTLLALVLGGTLGLGGLIFGTINVVSMGFAAILLGLAVDYAVVHYQEALAHPALSIPQIRHAIAPSIFWAAVTTITAFLVLNFGGLPGLGQLGTLVGLGVALSALVMIFEYLPPLFPNRREANPQSSPDSSAPHSRDAVPQWRMNLVLTVTAIVVIFSFSVLLFRGAPAVDSSANALRPRESPAYDALTSIQNQLNQNRAPLWLIVGGKTETDVGKKLEEIQAMLSRAQSNGVIADFTLPTAIWPRPDFQSQNRVVAAQLATEGDALRAAALANGFADSSLGLSERMLETWRTAAADRGVFRPTNEMCAWIFDKVMAVTTTNDFALGLVNPATNNSAGQAAGLAGLESELPHEETWLSGWELLGTAIFSRVKANLWKVVAPMVFLVMLSLWLAFRRPREIVLSLSVLVLSGVCLLAVMQLAHWSWNLLNLMAIPLILGTGVDYSIFMQLALRRYGGNLVTAHRAVGRALLLCGATAIAAFGSLAWSSNVGMASLGATCAVGIAGNMLIAVFLLPVWWRGFSRDGAKGIAGDFASDPKEMLDSK